MCAHLDASLAAAITDTLDGLGAGVFLVDSGGRIVHANVAGRKALDRGDVLRCAAGRLVVREAKLDRSLLDALAAAASGNRAVGIRGIAVSLTARDGTRHIARVLPLTRGARRQAGATTCTAVAAVFVNEAMLDASSLPEFIAKTYKLTPTELRILLAIVDVGGVPDVAEAMGIAESTVRTHLARLFEKTGTGRQVDLVKLVAGFSVPLMG